MLNPLFFLKLKDSWKSFKDFKFFFFPSKGQSLVCKHVWKFKVMIEPVHLPSKLWANLGLVMKMLELCISSLTYSSRFWSLVDCFVIHAQHFEYSVTLLHVWYRSSFGDFSINPQTRFEKMVNLLIVFQFIDKFCILWDAEALAFIVKKMVRSITVRMISKGNVHIPWRKINLVVVVNN